ncbi:MAG: polysaccharide deacetylase family protein [Proteobacteria bacterium]|nr:polysaccharide deacetylase family protein [Pseudomonadota bacterium]
MPLKRSTSLKSSLTGLFKASVQRATSQAARLKRNLSTVLATSVLLLFFLYIPFIHGPLNAGIIHSDSTAPQVATKSYINPSSTPPAATPYIAATPSAIVQEPAPTTVAEHTKPASTVPNVLGAEKIRLGELNKDLENGPLPLTHELHREESVKSAKHQRGDSAWSHAPVSLASPPDVTRGAKNKYLLSITFDGGYSASEAGVVLDELRKRGIKTTIFLSGTFMNLHPDVTVRIVEDGHEVGNHTATHPHLTDYASTYTHKTLKSMNRTKLLEELRGAEKLFTSITGTSMAPLWRAPYGEVNRELRAWAFEFGYLHIGWTYENSTKESLDTLDWVSEPSSRFYLSANEILERVTGFGKESGGAGGGIILMHLGTQRKSDRASSVLGEMLDELRGRGYRFVKVSTMLNGNSALKTAFRRKSVRSYKKLSKIR